MLNGLKESMKIDETGDFKKATKAYDKRSYMFEKDWLTRSAFGIHNENN